MAGTNNHQSQTLEEQLRGMILKNAPRVTANPSWHASQQEQQPHTTATRNYFPEASTMNISQAHSSFSNPVPASQQPRQQQHGHWQAPFSSPVGQSQQQQYRHQHRNYPQRGYFNSRAPGGLARDGPDHFPPAQHAEAASYQRARYQQHVSLDPNAFRRDNFGPIAYGSTTRPQNLFNPNQVGPPPTTKRGEYTTRQAQYLEQLARHHVSETEMPQSEHDMKNAFRGTLQRVLGKICENDKTRFPDISLECFGSFKSGFATQGSDMDLVIVAKGLNSTAACFSFGEHDLPRVLEKRLLELGYGARLLSRTRVPIIKICEKPTPELLDLLRKERASWDSLSEQEKYPHLYPDQPGTQEDKDAAGPADGVNSDEDQAQIEGEAKVTVEELQKAGADDQSTTVVQEGRPDEIAPTGQQNNEKQRGSQQPRRAAASTWTRERKAGLLDFPKEGVGIQCDINFFNPLGLHNTQMLRCYSLCDPRVRPMVVFIKTWAKRRKINSSYSGTLSSYGYVLMVLHYLVNVANPPVLPNLQSFRRPQATNEGPIQVDGWTVDFWRNENEIKAAASRGELSTNTSTLGELLIAFFQYYASPGGDQFRWTHQVLSLRSPGGILTKEEKGWRKAMTEESAIRRVQHRFLFCIEDPFEISHNVARTVTHNGIVAIRDEFRRARRIIIAVGNGLDPHDGGLFDAFVEGTTETKPKRQKPMAKQLHTQAGAQEPIISETNIQVNSSPADGTAPVRGGRGFRGRHRGVATPRGVANVQGGRANTALNVADNEAFPALGGSKDDSQQKRGRSNHHNRRGRGRSSKPSGDHGEMNT